MRSAMDETERRRKIQDETSLVGAQIKPQMEYRPEGDAGGTGGPPPKLTKREVEEEIARTEKQMKEAAKMMEFEYAAVLRDRLIELRKGPGPPAAG